MSDTEATAPVGFDATTTATGADVRHALHCPWVLWFDTPSSSSSGTKKKGPAAFGSNLRKVAVITTIEEFWGVMNNIVSANKLVRRVRACAMRVC